MLLDIELRTGGGRRVDRTTWRLDAATLAAPVLAAGRDWLRLQGADPGSCEEHAAFAGGGSTDLVIAELRSGGAALWQGSVPHAEVARIAVRAVRARQAAGLWPRIAREDGDKVTYRLRAPRAGAAAAAAAGATPAPAVAADASLGIDWEAAPGPSAAPALPLAEVVDAEDFRVRAVLAAGTGQGCDAGPDLVLAFRPRAWHAVRALCAESSAAGQERALLLHGRRARTPGAAGFVPWFEVTGVERPEHRRASASGLELGPAPMAGPAAHGAIGLLHTHLPGCGVEASDSDRRDIEDLDHGGPAAISVICEAPDDRRARVPLAVWARLGRRRGHILRACARVVVAAPRATAGRAPAPFRHPVSEESR